MITDSQGSDRKKSTSSSGTWGFNYVYDMAIDHKCPARSDKKIQRRGRRDWQFTWHKRSASEEEAPKRTRKNQHLEYWPQSAASVSQHQGTTTSNRSKSYPDVTTATERGCSLKRGNPWKEREREREREKEGEEGEEIRVRARIIVWHVSRVAAEHSNGALHRLCLSSVRDL